MKNNASYWWLLGISLICRIPPPGEIFYLRRGTWSNFSGCSDHMNNWTGSLVALYIKLRNFLVKESTEKYNPLDVVHKGRQILTSKPRESLSVELRNLFLRYSLVIWYKNHQEIKAFISFPHWPFIQEAFAQCPHGIYILMVVGRGISNMTGLHNTWYEVCSLYTNMVGYEDKFQWAEREGMLLS